MKNDKLPHYLKAIIVSDPELVAILNQNTKEDKNYRQYEVTSANVNSWIYRVNCRC